MSHRDPSPYGRPRAGAPAPWADDPPLHERVPDRESLEEPMTEVDAVPAALVDPDVPRLEEDPGFDQRYVYDQQLGQGGMGTVDLHLDRQIGRRVAMKRMRENTAETRSRFVREARIQAQLEHPSVVPVYDLALEPGGLPFFTMRRVRGHTLDQILERLAEGAPSAFREQHSTRRLLAALSRVCLAVQYAHEHGVLHRDLKPSNVILGDFGEIYLLDWGLAGLRRGEEAPPRELKAVHITRETMQGSMMGTPGYVSPEQARGEIHGLTPASDVYSLGSILFEILTLVPLHDASSPILRLDSTIRGTERRPSIRDPAKQADPALDSVVLRATELSPNDRYPSARALHAALESYLDGRRDREARQQQAAEQAALAAKEAEQALDPSGSPERRRLALRSAFDALAFDPNNQSAVDTVLRLVRDAPRELPPEAQASLASAAFERLRWMGGVASITYAAMFLYIPLFAASPVRTWWPILVTYGCLLGAAVLSLRLARSREPSTALVLASMWMSNIGMAATAPLMGPLLVMPTLVALNTAPYVLYLGGRGRWVSIAVALFLVTGSVALSVLGVIPGEYRFVDGALVIESGMVALAPLPTLLLLIGIAVGQVAAAGLGVARMRVDLDRAERLFHAQSWLIRGLVSKPRREERER